MNKNKTIIEKETRPSVRMRNLAITALHAHATLLIEMHGTVTYKQLRKETEKLEKLGVDHQDVYNALFQVCNLVNVTF
jgi:hypothetical protein